MSPSFLVKILCYTYKSFTSTLAPSVYICAGRFFYPHRLQDQTATSTDDASVMVKGLHV